MPFTTIPILDPSDPRVAEYRAIERPSLARLGGYFVAEGRTVVERLLAAPRLRVRSLLLNDAAFRALEAAMSRLTADTPIYLAPTTLFEAITGFNIHRGCLALADRPADVDLPALTAGARTLVVVENCDNADNLGGIFRNAAAFAADGVVLSPSAGDPLYRKAIRTSMAAAFRVPFSRAADWPGDLMALKEAGFVVVAMTPRIPSVTLDELAVRGRPSRVAVLVGAEGDGLTAEALALADVRVRVPIAPDVDSLNVAVATGIALSRLSLVPTL